MPVSFAQIAIGQEYHRPELAAIWGYTGFQAIARGIVTPRGTPFIILFITKEKQSFLTQYEDSFSDGILEIEGETDHIADDRIVNAQANGDEIHLFFRDRHHSAFVYQGQILLTDYTIFTNKPSAFRFATDPLAAKVDSALEVEALTHGVTVDEFVPDAEGREKIIQSIQYERSRKNRRRAIEHHGNRCIVCGFDFDAFYGADHAKGFIEVHHTRSVADMEGKLLNVDTDLAPVCSNCHSMLHRRRGAITSIEDLMHKVERAKRGTAASAMSNL